MQGSEKWAKANKLSLEMLWRGYAVNKKHHLFVTCPASGQHLGSGPTSAPRQHCLAASEQGCEASLLFPTNPAVFRNLCWMDRWSNLPTFPSVVWPQSHVDKVSGRQDLREKQIIVYSLWLPGLLSLTANASQQVLDDNFFLQNLPQL